MILVGDIGGTKTDLAIFPTHGEPQPQVQATFQSASYPSLEAIVKEFLASNTTSLTKAVFGVAGPVVNGESRITNLSWEISEKKLGNALNLPDVKLLNDLEAIAYAVPHLGPPDLEALNSEQGFSLHAGVHCGPHQRSTLERLCRYITRPALGHKRLARTPRGDVALELKTPYRDGTTHVVMPPLEFLQRLAALVPRPRLHLIRFHGVLAPNSALRSQIVPEKPDHATNPPDDPTDEPARSAQTRLKWAQLLKRVFEIDMSVCPTCGGPLTMIAAPSTSSGQESKIPRSFRGSSPI